MRRHLCISVTFLDPLFHGKGDGDEPEWPPSPMRLFQALLAGARIGCRNRQWSQTTAAVFRWLEQRHPPVIVAPAARPTSAYTLFVPNNDADKEFERQDRLTSKIAAPHRLCDGDTLHYVWPIGETDWASAQPHAEALCGQARRILALGWGIDQVVGNGRILTAAEAAALTGHRWCAKVDHRSGGKQWRIPAEGSLDDLLECHQQFINSVDGKLFRPPKRPSVYGHVVYLPDSAVSPRSFAVFELMRPDDADRRQALRQQDANVVAAMLRSLACRLARGDSHEFPNGSDVYVAGHKGNKEDRRPRFSYIVLPTIGHPSADGMIRRVMIAEPHGSDGTHAAWAASRLRGQVLTDNAGRPATVLRTCDAEEKVVRRYMEPSRNWASVTPIILPGYDDFKAIKPDRAAHATKAERLFLKAVEQAGIPIQAVTDVALRKAPVWPGSLHPSQYRRPDYLQHLPGWHVRIAFREPVEGPIVLGAGRHCGLGVFAAEDQGAT